VVVLYRPESEHGRPVEEFVREFQHRYQDDKLELVNIDSREGNATASLYDIVQYPAILVLQTDGSLQNMWQGDALPLLDEVAAYARA